MGITMTSCKDDKEGNEPSYDLRTYIVGEWASAENPSVSFTFKNDGTGHSHYSTDVPFRWKLTGNNLEITHTSSSYLDQDGEVEILGKNKMKWGYLTYNRTSEYVEPSDPSDPSDPSNPSGKFAPASLVGKIIRWNESLANGGGSTGYDNRIQFYTEHDMRANWASQSSSYTYAKTGDNTGHLNFICGQTVSGVTRVFRYDITLTFKDKEGNFDLKGHKEITGALNGNGTYQIVGSGSFWPELWK